MVKQLPKRFMISRTISDPDKYINEIFSNFDDNEENQAIKKAINSLSHEEKVQWLLSLPDINKLDPMDPDLTVVVVVVVTVVILAVGSILSQRLEKETYEEEVEKCVFLNN